MPSSSRSHRSLLLGLILLCGFAAPGLSGEMHPNFVELLATAPPDNYLSGLLMLEEQPDPMSVKQELATLGLSSRWRRHEFVVRHAQEVAARTQADLLVLLEALKAEGGVRTLQSFWVTNMIAVEALPEIFDRLAARDDVGIIYENAQIDLRLGWDDEPPQGDSGLRDLPSPLTCINVGPAWDLGYRGAGSLVCAFDGGVDGDHAALIDKWRGSQPGVEWWEAWKDPYIETEFPFDSGTHGTHVTGIMVAENHLDGSPIGVAPDAQWIAAGVLIQYNVQKIIECYEWAVDPDGNPGTIDDVPDVINNSWGTSHDCDMSYWNAIDLVEAAGIVNTIAVDNSGPGYASVNSPESRADSPTANFGVGNVNPHEAGYPISNSSGRGPSPCDDESIKPEVTGPGTQIFSTLPNDQYGTKSGTSMACPHTSGAVAILRQANPDLTVDEIKTILMDTAYDRGDVGEDNDYGYGIIDVGAALDYVLANAPSYPPRNLTAVIDELDVTLTWDIPEQIYPGNPLMKYRIYRAPLGEPYSLDPIGELTPPFLLLRYIDQDVPIGQYHYVVTALYQREESGPSNEISVNIQDPLASASELLPVAGDGLGVAPNPFNPVTVIRYASSGPEPLSVTIYDASGARIKRLVDAATPPTGIQAVVWDGTDEEGYAVASGAYYVRMEQSGRIAMRRATLLK